MVVVRVVVVVAMVPVGVRVVRVSAIPPVASVMIVIPVVVVVSVGVQTIHVLVVVGHLTAWWLARIRCRAVGVRRGPAIALAAQRD